MKLVDLKENEEEATRGAIIRLWKKGKGMKPIDIDGISNKCKRW